MSSSKWEFVRHAEKTVIDILKNSVFGKKN